MKIIHGGDIYAPENKGLIDFSANINPLGLPQGVAKAMIAGIHTCSTYPDPLCRALTKAIGEKENMPLDTILCGNGAADIIFRLVYGCKPKKALVLAPTFAEYEQALGGAGCKVIYYTLKKENDFVVQRDILDCLHHDISMVFLCNPNNPTGQVIEQELLQEIVAMCQKKQIILVVDECFCDFLEEGKNHSALQWLMESPYLIILKAFTKLYAMAGVRLGYCLCSNPEIIKKIEEGGQPWSVSALAQVAGVQATKECAYVKETQLLIKKERAYLKEKLQAYHLNVIGSHANYLFFYSEDKKLHEKLKKRGFTIRNCGNYVGLEEGYYRIGIQKHEENEALIAALKDIWADTEEKRG